MFIEEMANGDWYYQIHSHLEYFPKPGEKISCVVEHASSHRPMNYHWDPSLPDSERSKIILGSVGLLMGVFMAAGGLIYYKTHRLLQTSSLLLPVQTMNGTEQNKTRSYYLFSHGIRKGNEKALLVCSAYDFYPKPTNQTWMRDDTKMKANEMSTG
ncbi:hypothetical protein cypCar_00034131 [Cyprinus carpio]|nr:hypothetical protein cypCar_00034131 [Cyprinus carpio]